MPFFKHIAISILILSTIGSTLTVPLVYLDFEMRREYIAEVLCINRDKPIAVCGGTCYLNLNLEKSTPNPQTPPSNYTNLLGFYFQEIEAREFCNPFAIVDPYLFVHTTEGKPTPFTNAVFEPPRVRV